MALQNYFGTYADGEIWHQWAPNVNRNGALTSGWMCDGTAKGSPVIRALQNILGVTADGIIGTDTIMALQTRWAHTSMVLLTKVQLACKSFSVVSMQALSSF